MVKELRGETLHYYPFTCFVIAGWIGYIGAMIYLLERAVATATIAYPQVWWLDWLPSILLTGFAQGHTAVTAMHLARLAVSALHDQNTSPGSWAELFWLADRNWAGPFGMSATVMGKAKLKGSVSLSSTYLFFTLTCLFAFPAPIVVSRAYPLWTVQYQGNTSTALNTFNPDLLLNLDYVNQLSTAAGAWVTGLSVADIHNNSVYTPDGYRSDATGDFVFAGEVSNHVVTLPAIRLQGGCEPINVDPAVAPATQDAFYDWCDKQMPDKQYQSAFYLTAGTWGLNVSSRWCTNFNNQDTTWINKAPAYNATTLIWFDAVGTVTPVTGFIQCNAAFATGHARVNGLTGRYTNFVQEGFYNTTIHRGGTGLVHPLYGTMYELSMSFSGKSEMDKERAAIMLRMLGYTPIFDDDKGMSTFTQPSLDQVAQQLWAGTSHMTASIGLLARGISSYQTLELTTVSGRQRNMPFIYGGALLLTGWLSMLIFCTLRMFRATFGDSLDSYVAGRLLADVPYLVTGHCCGELSDNSALCQDFKRVGDSGAGYPIGHVASGGVGVLVSRREYGARPPA